MATRKTTFKRGAANPGHRSNRPKTGAGRKKGSINKVTRDMKEAVLNAFEKLGGEDYLVRLARKKRDPHATALLGLFKAIIPVKLQGDPKQPIQVVMSKTDTEL